MDEVEAALKWADQPLDRVIDRDLPALKAIHTLAQALREATAAKAELLGACRAAHTAIDLLFAMLIEAKPGFYPSKSGQPWEAMTQVFAAISQHGAGK